MCSSTCNEQIEPTITSSAHSCCFENTPLNLSFVLALCSIIVAPRDKNGNPLQYMDEASKLTLNVASDRGGRSDMPFTARPGILNGTSDLTYILDVSCSWPAANLEVQLFAYSLPLRPTAYVSLPTSVSPLSTTLWWWDSVPAGTQFSYALHPYDLAGQPVNNGGDDRFVQTSMCALPGTANGSYPQCPTLAPVACSISPGNYDRFFGEFYVGCSAAPQQPGMYRVVTLVSGVPLTEAANNLTVTPPLAPPQPPPAPQQMPPSTPGSSFDPEGETGSTYGIPGILTVQITAQTWAGNTLSTTFQITDKFDEAFSSANLVQIYRDVNRGLWFPFTSTPVRGYPGAYVTAASVPTGTSYEVWTYWCYYNDCSNVVNWGAGGYLIFNTNSPLLAHWMTSGTAGAGFFPTLPIGQYQKVGPFQLNVLSYKPLPTGWTAVFFFGSPNAAPGLWWTAVVRDINRGSWYQFPSVEGIPPMATAGTYNITVSVPPGSVYEYWVYRCNTPDCRDVFNSTGGGGLSVYLPQSDSNWLLGHDYMYLPSVGGSGAMAPSAGGGSMVPSTGSGAMAPSSGKGGGGDQQVLFVPGLGSIEVLQNIDRPNGWTAIVRFNNTNGVPTSGRIFMAVLRSLSTGAWYSFTAAPFPGAGMYNLTVSVPSSGSYDEWVYACQVSNCSDVINYAAGGALLPSTTAPQIMHDTTYFGNAPNGSPQNRVVYLPGYGTVSFNSFEGQPNGWTAYFSFNDTTGVPAPNRMFILVAQNIQQGTWYKFKAAPWAAVGTYSVAVWLPPGFDYQYWFYPCSQPDCSDIFNGANGGSLIPTTTSPLIAHDFFHSGAGGGSGFAPAPAPQGGRGDGGGDQGPKVIPGIGSIELLQETQSPTSHNYSFRFRDVAGAPKPGMNFVAVLTPSPGLVTSTFPFASYAVAISPPGDYNISFVMSTSGSYGLGLYVCATPSCADVMPAPGKLSASATPIVTDTVVFATGPLSPQTTAVYVQSAGGVGVSWSLMIVARDGNGLMRGQERDGGRFTVSADHNMTGTSLTDRLDGTYLFRFTPQEAARYTFTVSMVSSGLERETLKTRF